MIEEELTVAKIIEIESQKVTGLLAFMGGNKTVTGITPTEQLAVDSARAAI